MGTRITRNGLAEITGCLSDISGSIAYYSDGTPVSDVLVELDGDEYRSVATDPDGNYLISHVPEGHYTVTPYKNDHFGGISGMDASRIAKYAAGFPEIVFDCHQMIAADVNRDGEITGLDASRVARYAAGKISYLNGEDTHWVFVPTSDEESICSDWPPISFDAEREYVPLETDQENQDFLAIRLGDVTGNWSDEPVRERRHSRSVCEVEAEQGTVLTVPVVLAQDTEIEGADIRLTFDADVLDFTGATLAGGILEDKPYALLKGGTGDGEVKIVISASGEAFFGSGETVFLGFDVKGQPGDTALISLADFGVNEESAPGGFRTEGRTCLDIRLIVTDSEADTAFAK